MKTNNCVFYSLFWLAILPLGAFAMNDVVASFVGGLNINQIQQCEKIYEKSCAVPDAKTLGEELSQKWPCMKAKMKQDNTCQQAYMIQHLTDYPPSEMKEYPNKMVVFTITALADGQTIFYIVDKSGRFIELTADEKLVSSNKNYAALKKLYPELSLTTFISWSETDKNQFPKSYLLKDKSTQLVFKQELRDGPCVACKPVAIAEVAYYFNTTGKFSSTQVLKIETLIQSFSKLK
jgi:hypothetical protein